MNSVVVTFYSHDNEAGIAAIFANIAWNAASEGKKVVIVDCNPDSSNLEVIHVFRDAYKTYRNDDHKGSGIFEFLKQYKQTGKTSSLKSRYTMEPIISDDFDDNGMIYIIPASKGGDKTDDYSLVGNLREVLSTEFKDGDLILINTPVKERDFMDIYSAVIPDQLIVLSGLTGPEVRRTKKIIHLIDKQYADKINAKGRKTVNVSIVGYRISSGDQRSSSSKEVEAAENILKRDIDVVLPPVAAATDRGDIVITDDKNNELGNGYKQIYDLLNLIHSRVDNLIKMKEKELAHKLQSADFINALDLCDDLIGLYGRTLYKRELIRIYTIAGSLQYLLKRYSRAIDLYNNIIEIVPDNSDAYFNRGIAYSDINEFEKAITDYTKVISFNDTDIDAFINRGIAYYNIHEYQNAMDDFNRVISLVPDDAAAYDYRGVVYTMLEEYDNAIADFNRVIALDAGYVSCYTHWAEALMHKSLLYEEPKRNTLLHEAIRKLSKAKELDSMQGIYATAAAYALLKDKQKALHWLKEAIDNGMITRNDLVHDPHWEYYYNDTDFEQLLSKFPD